MSTPSFDDDEDGSKVPESFREAFRTHHVKDFDKKSMGLKPIRMDTALGLAFVNLSGEAPPLDVWLGDLLPSLGGFVEATADPSQLRATHRKSYNIKANWKLLVENYLEYYHLPAVHPALCDVSTVDTHRRNQGAGMYMGFATDPLNAGDPPTAIDPGQLPAFPALAPGQRQMAYHIAIFPNTFFSLYPDNFFRIVLSPTSATTTLEQATLITHAGAMEAPDAQRIMDDMFAFWDNVNTEDIMICEEAQLGTAAPVYGGGRFSFRFEEPVHRFQNMVIDKMVDDDETRFRIPKGDEPKPEPLAASG